MSLTDDELMRRGKKMCAAKRTIALQYNPDSLTAHYQVQVVSGERVAARTAGRGLWPADRTNTGFNVPNISAVMNTRVILPKLFRCLVACMGTGGSVTGFKETA